MSAISTSNARPPTLIGWPSARSSRRCGKIRKRSNATPAGVSETRSIEAAAAAEDQFRQALDWARRQGALSWELRVATSLARLLRDGARSADATALLQPVYDRFTEGFDTADLKAAKALLDALQ
jgi:hypothetical protein